MKKLMKPVTNKILYHSATYSNSIDLVIEHTTTVSDLFHLESIKYITSIPKQKQFPIGFTPTWI